MKEEIQKSIQEFQKIFGREANVELIEIKENEIKVKFSGHMCYTCGTIDYFDDFAQILSENLKEKWIAENYEIVEEAYIVTFKPEKFVKEKQREVKFLFFE